MAIKGGISLKDFICQVKEELKSAVDNENPFFHMNEVELEVSFTLEVGGGGKAKLMVVEVGGQTKATQAHTVRIKLEPFVPVKPSKPIGLVHAPSEQKPAPSRRETRPTAHSPTKSPRTSKK